MKIQAIRTHLVQANEQIFDILDAYLPKLEERNIVAVTSKIISICEGSLLEKKMTKHELVKQEADCYLDEENPHGVLLTIKNGILIPNAGIDESNAAGTYILYPKNIFLSAAQIWSHLRTRHHLNHLGVIITDSHTTPLRWGVTGIGIGWCGFHPLNNYIGTPECHGCHLKFTKVNVLDALAAAAVFTMGEGNEQTPLALLTELAKVDFADTPPTPEEIASLKIPIEQDIYGPLFSKGKWV